MLNWAKQFNIFCLLDNNQYSIAPQQYECLLAVGATASVQASIASINDVDAFIDGESWVFGHLSYELNHRQYNIVSNKEDLIVFPAFYFYKPQAVLFIRDNKLHIQADNADEIYNSLLSTIESLPVGSTNVTIQQRFSKHQYINTVQQLQQHILRGDCYEINFCQEFFAEKTKIDPFTVFQSLQQYSPNPFAALYRINDQFLVCASPERFLVKKADSILSQPIKGTAARSINKNEDRRLREALLSSGKERTENVMVVDLVRNDLARVCRQGTVKVDELYGIYSFPQVHQMISTISGILKEDVQFSDVIDATFPMGSMTGAPKYRVMQLIDQYEPFSRGIFSGAVGYIAPNGDFDFSVVIRGIMYNADSQYLSYKVGSGITFYSNAEDEWKECLLKGEAIKKVLT